MGKENFANKLKEYFKNTPREEVLKAWEKTEKFDKVEPKVKDFLENTAVISRFSVGDTVRLVSKREFYCSTKIGSKGVIQKSSNSSLGVCHWVKFKTHENWIYEEQLDFWES